MSTAPSIPPASEQSLWFYADASNRPQGPVDFDELQRLAKEGVVGAGTPIISQGGAEWTTYSSIVDAVDPILAPVAESPRLVQEFASPIHASAPGIKERLMAWSKNPIWIGVAVFAVIFKVAIHLPDYAKAPSFPSKAAVNKKEGVAKAAPPTMETPAAEKTLAVSPEIFRSCFNSETEARLRNEGFEGENLFLLPEISVEKGEVHDVFNWTMARRHFCLSGRVNKASQKMCNLLICADVLEGHALESMRVFTYISIFSTKTLGGFSDFKSVSEDVAALISAATQKPDSAQVRNYNTLHLQASYHPGLRTVMFSISPAKQPPEP